MENDGETFAWKKCEYALQKNIREKYKNEYISTNEKYSRENVEIIISLWKMRENFFGKIVNTSRKKFHENVDIIVEKNISFGKSLKTYRKWASVR